MAKLASSSIVTIPNYKACLKGTTNKLSQRSRVDRNPSTTSQSNITACKNAVRTMVLLNG